MDDVLRNKTTYQKHTISKITKKKKKQNTYSNIFDNLFLITSTSSCQVVFIQHFIIHEEHLENVRTNVCSANAKQRKLVMFISRH